MHSAEPNGASRSALMPSCTSCRTGKQSKHPWSLQDLKDESRSLTYRRGDPPPTEAEQRWYDRPIRHASAHLIASTNARLTNIRVSVSEAHSDIVRGINRLKQRERE